MLSGTSRFLGGGAVRTTIGRAEIGTRIENVSGGAPFVR
jgi:hypothetical protein